MPLPRIAGQVISRRIEASRLAWGARANPELGCGTPY
jgi:hypothetical protein